MTQVCERGVPLGNAAVRLPSTCSEQQELNTAGVFPPSRFLSSLLDKEGWSAILQVLDLHFFLYMFSARRRAWREGGGQRASTHGSQVCFECVTPGNRATDL